MGLVEDEDAGVPSSSAATGEVGNPSSGNVRLISGQTPDPPRSPSLLRTESAGYMRGEARTSPLEIGTEVLQVEGFQDCPHLTSWYKAGVPVMLDMRTLPAMVAQGVVYYASGLASYNQGRTTQVGDGLVLVTPPGARVSQSEKVRLSKIGMWPSGTDV